MKLLVHNLIRNNCGATAIEYGMLVALVALAAATALSQFTPTLNNIYTIVDNSTTNSVSGD